MTDDDTSLIILAILLIILLIVITVLFTVWNSQYVHAITVQNSTSQPLTIIGLGSNFNLNPNQKQTRNVTSGSNLRIQGFYATGVFGDGTEVKINLTSGTDTYGISVQRAFNLKATVTPTNNFIIKSSDPYSCRGVTWNFTPGLTGTSNQDCPLDLQYDVKGNMGEILYQTCLSPCTKYGLNSYCCRNINSCSNNSCQETWGNQIEYWNLFYGACPTCLITDCESTNYYCENSTSPISYLITFFE